MIKEKMMKQEFPLAVAVRKKTRRQITTKKLH